MSKEPQKPQSKLDPQAVQRATVRYIDQPNLAETFADSLNSLYFDGQTLRIEFGVTRFNQAKPNEAMTGRRFPACRLVLPPMVVADLIKRLHQIGSAIVQAGAAKQGDTTAPAKTK